VSGGGTARLRCEREGSRGRTEAGGGEPRSVGREREDAVSVMHENFDPLRFVASLVRERKIYRMFYGMSEEVFGY
jgi:hypothetical protein